MTRSVHVNSFGCQMNELDTALISSALTQGEYT